MATHIQSTTQPYLYAVRSNPDILWSGLLEVGQALGTPLELISALNDTDFLAAANGKAGSYAPLPGVGALLKAGEIYGYNLGLVIVRQDHIRTVYAPEDTPALFSVYRAGQTGVLEWVASEKVFRGQHRTYSGQEYVCLQDHVTQTDWTPVATLGALWGLYVVTNNWAVGVAYKIGDVVLYVPNGFTYRCLQAHTSIATWTPPATPALWAKVS